jgi:hypothetical protein
MERFHHEPWVFAIFITFTLTFATSIVLLAIDWRRSRRRERRGYVAQ